MRKHLFARHVLHVLVAKHAHVRGAERVGEIDKAPRLIELGGVLDRIHIVHLRRRAEIGDDQPVRGKLAFDVAEMLGRKLGHLGEIHVRLDATQLDGGKGVRGGEIEDLRPGPLGTPERREPEREASGVWKPHSVRGREHCGGSLEELAAARHGHGRIVATTAVVHSPWLFL